MFSALIMAGGSGTRLWPLSREEKPKQSLNLIGGRSMFQHAVERLSPLFPLDRIWIVTRKEHVDRLHSQVAELSDDQFIVEPEGRGTAPAIGLAAIHLYRQDPEGVMAVLTADHFISDTEKFRQVLSAAKVLAEKDYLVTLGINPTNASTAFGYIEHGQNLEMVEGFKVFRVRAFTEKPNRDTAARMVSSGIYSWNSGMFIWKVKRILEEFYRQMPEFYEELMRVDEKIGTSDYVSVLSQVWPRIAKQTIDYGIMEAAKDVAVIPVEMGWTDVGSWSSLIGLLPSDDRDNSVLGDHLGIDTSGTLVFGDQRLIATIGIKDLIIVDTDDALLICARGQEQRVRELVETLRAQDRKYLI